MRRMNMTEGNLNEKRLLSKIREYDFALLETVEFLDTHPQNLKALRYYSKLRSDLDILISEYEERFGPMTMYGNMNENGWDWIDGPWPWEGK